MGNIKEFMELARTEIEEMMPADIMKNITLEETTVTKINDQVLHGITFKREDNEPSPTIYMDEPFRQYMEGESTLKGLISRTIQEYLQSLNQRPESVMEDFSFRSSGYPITVPGSDCFRSSSAPEISSRRAFRSGSARYAFASSRPSSP